MSMRSERARRRAAKRRSQRTILGVLAILVLIAIGALAYSAFGRRNQPAPAQTMPASSSMVTTASGLQYQDLVIGSGPEAKSGDTVSMNYTGTLEDGTKFDSSYDRNQTFDFVLGSGNVIKGWDEGIVGMKVGGKRKLVIPPDLAYGAQGYPPVIPPNATLLFEVELMAIK